MHTTADIVTMLNQLEKRQLEMFKAICFDNFLELSSFFIQNQFIHILLHKDIVPEEPNKLCVNIVVLTFDLKEFAIMTDLKCFIDDSNVTAYDSPEKNYFGGAEKVHRYAVLQC